jgi:hypothetical protein
VQSNAKRLGYTYALSIRTWPQSRRRQRLMAVYPPATGRGGEEKYTGVTQFGRPCRNLLHGLRFKSIDQWQQELTTRLGDGAPGWRMGGRGERTALAGRPGLPV